MSRTIHFFRFIAASFGIHLLFLAAVVYFAGRAGLPPSEVTPVNIVNLPQDALRSLPPVSRPVPPAPQPAPLPPPPRERIIPPKEIPAPKKFGTSPDVALPRTTPGQGQPRGSDRGSAEQGGTGGGSVTGTPDVGAGPLPFLSQADIDTLARKGMPEKRPGEDSVTLDTDEFRYITYNRWLKIKVESVLRYPELAAVSGLQGTLYIKFDINKDGSLSGLELLKSSGYKILDDEALRAIRASAPFQPLPDEWRTDRYSIRAAVLFYLSGAYIR
jgi:protein TonB